MAVGRGEGETTGSEDVANDVTAGGTMQRSGNVLAEAALAAAITTVVGLLLLFSVWVIPFPIFAYVFNRMELVLLGAFGAAALAALFIGLDLYRRIFRSG